MKLKSGKLANYLLIILTAVTANSAFCQTPKVIDDHFKSLTAHDVKAIAAGYSDDAQAYSPNWEGAKTGVAGITEVYTRYFSSTPDLWYQVTNTINAGDNVIVEYNSGGTLSNPESGTPAYMKDKKYRINYCAIFTVKNGKIAKETDYFDQLAFLRQVGFFDQK